MRLKGETIHVSNINKNSFSRSGSSTGGAKRVLFCWTDGKNVSLACKGCRSLILTYRLCFLRKADQFSCFREFFHLRLTLIHPPWPAALAASSVSERRKPRPRPPPPEVSSLLLVTVRRSGPWRQAERRWVGSGRRQRPGHEGDVGPGVRREPEGGRPGRGAVWGAVVSIRVETGADENIRASGNTRGSWMSGAGAAGLTWTQSRRRRRPAGWRRRAAWPWSRTCCALLASSRCSLDWNLRQEAALQERTPDRRGQLEKPGDDQEPQNFSKIKASVQQVKL